MLQRDLRGMFNPYANPVDNVFAELRLHQKFLSDEYAKLVIDTSLSRCLNLVARRSAIEFTNGACARFLRG
jgi:hypothetical protein